VIASTTRPHRFGAAAIIHRNLFMLRRPRDAEISVLRITVENYPQLPQASIFNYFALNLKKKKAIFYI